jgi:peptidoglycan/LPS O-acetylase OafA/YrhL
MKASVSTFIDLSRWMAAFMVVISHARNLVLVNYEAVHQKGLLDRFIYSVTGFGHEAVVVFFVISGFLVGGYTYYRWRREGPDLTGYACARVSRIYTVLIFALLIGASLDYTGLHWLNASAIYSDAQQRQITSIQYAVETTMDAPTFLSSLLMLQGMFAPTFGSNVPLWSLAYEWWYYCLFALIGVAVLETGRRRAACAALALFIGVLLPPKVVLWGAIWCMGFVAYRWVRSRWWRPPPALGMVIFLASLLVSRVVRGAAGVDDKGVLLDAFVRDGMVGIGYVLALVSTSRMTSTIVWPRLQRQLSDFSYTTYLFHFPALLLLVSGSYQTFGIDFPQQPGVAGLAWLITCVMLVYVYCFASYVLIERQPPQVRRRLESMVRRGARALTAAPPDAKADTH